MLTHDGATDTRSIGNLIKDLKNDAAQLLRDEIALARTELSSSMSRGLRNLALLLTGALIGLLAAQALLVTLIAGVIVVLLDVTGRNMALWLAPLVVGLALAIIAAICIWVGKQRLSKLSITPRQTTETMRETQQWLRTRMS